MGVILRIKDGYKSHVEFVARLIYVGRCACRRRGDFSTTVVRDFNWPCTSGSDDDDDGVILKKRGWIQLYHIRPCRQLYITRSVCQYVHIYIMRIPCTIELDLRFVLEWLRRRGGVGRSTRRSSGWWVQSCVSKKKKKQKKKQKTSPTLIKPMPAGPAYLIQLERQSINGPMVRGGRRPSRPSSSTLPAHI